MTRTQKASWAKRFAASAAVLAAIAMVIAWKPAAPLRTRSRALRAEAAIAKRALHVSPAELATLMFDRRVPLFLFDLRDESAFNRFHLLDARRIDARRIDARRIDARRIDARPIDARPIDAQRSDTQPIETQRGDAYASLSAILARAPQRSVKIFIAHDETTAEEVVKDAILHGLSNVYLLAGGIPAWLSTFEGLPGGALREGALGSRHPASAPDLSLIQLPAFERRVELGDQTKRKGGGCG